MWLLVDIYLVTRQQGKYPLQATNTEVNICFSVFYNFEMIQP